MRGHHNRYGLSETAGRLVHFGGNVPSQAALGLGDGTGDGIFFRPNCCMLIVAQSPERHPPECVSLSLHNFIESPCRGDSKDTIWPIETLLEVFQKIWLVTVHIYHPAHD